MSHSEPPTSPSVRAVRKVAAARGTAPTELPTLADAIDTDALDSFVHSISTGAVVFFYADHLVTVTAEGTVTVQPIDAPGTGQ